MGQTTRCLICGKRMVPVVSLCGRTDLQCISCDDPAAKWAESPLTAPEKPIENLFDHSEMKPGSDGSSGETRESLAALGLKAKSN